jgi:hypothetical protein
VVNSKGDIFAGVENGGVHWSTDNGASWHSRALGLTASNINGLLATPGGNVLAATEQGVFILDSSKSASWKPYSDGLTVRNVQALCIDRDGYIYAGTDASGVFRSTATFNTIVSDVKLTGNNHGATALGTNYPNPFSTSTTIPFSLAERSFITIEVHDALGRSVAQVASGIYEAGKYETKFDAGNLATGTYFIRLKTEKQSYFTPCILSK